MSKGRDKKQPSGDFRPLGGSDRRYRSSDGTTISRRQYMNMQAKESGWKSWSDYQRASKDPLYQRLIKEGIADGKDYRKMRGMDSEFSRLFTKARGPMERKKGREYFSPKGYPAQILTYVGLRDEDAEYDLEDSP